MDILRPDDLKQGPEYRDKQQKEQVASALSHQEIQAASALMATEMSGEQGAEERAREIFLNSSLLVIEDSMGALSHIKKALSDVGKNNFFIAETAQEVDKRIDEILAASKAGDRVLVISDLNIPYEEDEVESSGAGVNALATLQRKVAEWNTANADQLPIALEIVMNSSEINSEKELQGFKELYKKNFSNPDAIVAGNPGDKGMSVEAFLAYLKAQEEKQDQ